MSMSTLRPIPTKAERLKRLTDTVSASRLQCWHRCRLQFYFKYILELVKPPTPALHVGKVVHAVLQAWNMSRWRKEPFQISVLQKFFDYDWKDRQGDTVINWKGEEEKQRKSAWAMLETFFAQTPIHLSERPEGVEVPVEADLKSHGLPTLVGIIDLIRSPGRVVDFKTAQRTPGEEQAPHLHEIQLSSYALMYRDATGKKESALELHHLVKTKMPKLVVMVLPPMNNKQETRLLRSIESYTGGLARRDFVPSPGFHCFWCEFFNDCRQWAGKEEAHGFK